jgi:hypothetical protein
MPHQFDVPSIGDIVYVECDTGEYEFPVAWGNVTKGLDEAPEIPEAFKRMVPSNRGIFTPGGHLVEFDDGESNPTSTPKDTDLTTKDRGIRITSSKNNQIHIIEDDDNSKQYILLKDASGSYLKLDYNQGKITITDNTSSIVIDKNADTVVSKNGQNKIFKLGDNKQILGQGTEHMVLGDTWFTMMDTFLSSIISGIVPGSPGMNAQSLIAIKQAATALQGSLPSFKSPNSFTD